MRKILVLLLLICFMAFPSIGGATSTSGSDTANVTVTYLAPVSLSVAVPAGTLYIRSSCGNNYNIDIWSVTGGWNSSYGFGCDDVDLASNGLSVFKLTGSAGQQVTISVDNEINAAGPGTLTLENNRICLGTDNTLLSSTTNCCEGGTVTDSNSVTATIPSTGEGYFAIRPNAIRMSDASEKGKWTATITVTAEYQ